MQVFYQSIHLLRSWSFLQHIEFENLFIRLEDTMRNIYDHIGLILHLHRCLISSHLILVIRHDYLFCFVGLD